MGWDGWAAVCHGEGKEEKTKHDPPPIFFFLPGRSEGLLCFCNDRDGISIFATCKPRNSLRAPWFGLNGETYAAPLRLFRSGSPISAPKKKPDNAWGGQASKQAK